MDERKRKKNQTSQIQSSGTKRMRTRQQEVLRDYIPPGPSCPMFMDATYSLPPSIQFMSKANYCVPPSRKYHCPGQFIPPRQEGQDYVTGRDLRGSSPSVSIILPPRVESPDKRARLSKSHGQSSMKPPRPLPAKSPPLAQSSTKPPPPLPAKSPPLEPQEHGAPALRRYNLRSSQPRPGTVQLARDTRPEQLRHLEPPGPSCAVFMDPTHTLPPSIQFMSKMNYYVPPSEKYKCQGYSMPPRRTSQETITTGTVLRVSSPSVSYIYPPRAEIPAKPARLSRRHGQSSTKPPPPLPLEPQEHGAPALRRYNLRSSQPRPGIVQLARDTRPEQLRHLELRPRKRKESEWTEQPTKRRRCLSQSTESIKKRPSRNKK